MVQLHAHLSERARPAGTVTAGLAVRPCILTHPSVTGDRLALALPEPPTYCWKLVTKPADEPVAGLEAAGAELAGAAAELAG